MNFANIISSHTKLYTDIEFEDKGYIVSLCSEASLNEIYWSAIQIPLALRHIN